MQSVIDSVKYIPTELHTCVRSTTKNRSTKLSKNKYKTENDDTQRAQIDAGIFLHASNSLCMITERGNRSFTKINYIIK